MKIKLKEIHSISSCPGGDLLLHATPADPFLVIEEDQHDSLPAELIKSHDEQLLDAVRLLKKHFIDSEDTDGQAAINTCGQRIFSPPPPKKSRKK